mmetsp:Transcript_43286/g.88494  ORF Transcript_43286/g.88494 Transcript_43286/m.88494 type:complete len:341 (-) Transcript_43286:51-1073(-)
MLLLHTDATTSCTSRNSALALEGFDGELPSTLLTNPPLCGRRRAARTVPTARRGSLPRCCSFSLLFLTLLLFGLLFPKLFEVVSPSFLLNRLHRPFVQGISLLLCFGTRQDIVTHLWLPANNKVAGKEEVWTHVLLGSHLGHFLPIDFQGLLLCRPLSNGEEHFMQVVHQVAIGLPKDVSVQVQAAMDQQGPLRFLAVPEFHTFFSDGEVGKEAIGGPRQLPVPSHWVERALLIPSSLSRRRHEDSLRLLPIFLDYVLPSANVLLRQPFLLWLHQHRANASGLLWQAEHVVQEVELLVGVTKVRPLLCISIHGNIGFFFFFFNFWSWNRSRCHRNCARRF